MVRYWVNFRGTRNGAVIVADSFVSAKRQFLAKYHPNGSTIGVVATRTEKPEGYATI